MSVDYYFVGLIEPNAQYEAYKKVWNDCKEAGIDIPKQVLQYFDFTDPNITNGIEVNIEKEYVVQTHDNHYTAYEIDLKKLPEQFTKIRFKIG